MVQSLIHALQLTETNAELRASMNNYISRKPIIVFTYIKGNYVRKDGTLKRLIYASWTQLPYARKSTSYKSNGRLLWECTAKSIEIKENVPAPNKYRQQLSYILVCGVVYFSYSH